MESLITQDGVAPRWEGEALLSFKVVCTPTSFLRLCIASLGMCGSGWRRYSSGLPRLLKQFFCTEQVPPAVRQLSLTVCQLRLDLPYSI